MRILVTGSAGHLGEALVRVLKEEREDVVGLDIVASPSTDAIGSILDPAFVRRSLDGVDAVFHTATLHKPHICSHNLSDFVDTNVSGTLNMLEAAADSGVRAFVFTSSTSTFGGALTPVSSSRAVWVDEEVVPVPRNIYGVTKTRCV